MVLKFEAESTSVILILVEIPANILISYYKTLTVGYSCSLHVYRHHKPVLAKL